MSGASYASDLLRKGNIKVLGLSEHWLYRHNLHFLQSINCSYNSFGVCDNDLLMPSNRRVGKGGVAILWHKSLDHHVTPLDITSDRICGIQYRLNQHLHFYILQVYAPSSNHPVQVYRDFIDHLHAIISMYCHYGLVILMGDFNAHLQGKRFIKSTDDRGKCLLDLMNYYNLVSLNTLSLCSGATSSFVSYDNIYESLIDHVLLPLERLDTVSSCEILDDHVLNTSRHRPIVCRISIPIADFEYTSLIFSSHVKWDKLDEHVLQTYKLELSNLLSSASCQTDLDPTVRLEQTYSHIVNVITSVTDSVLPKTKFRPYLKPYWDTSLKDLHASMRENRRKWIKDGRPRGNMHQSYRLYKTAKCLFRAHHRRCAEKFQTELNIEIDQAAELDSALFWKKVNSRRNNFCTNAGSEIKFGDNVCRDPESIVSGWGVYFRDLYSDTERPHYDQRFKQEVETKVQNIKSEIASDRNSIPTYISTDDVRKAVKTLKKKKACGQDCVYNEHLIHGGDTLYEHLAKFYTDMFNYGCIPLCLKQGIIITLHKGGRKSKTDPNNYRAITLSSAILKLFERLLLARVEASISKPLNGLQGGFRPNIGCNMTSTMVRECIYYAKENNSKLFACFLDIQKAFDKMWHNGLFTKLYDMGIRSKLLGIIIELHTNMKSRVLFKGHKSDWFDILQGSRQGGVLSPFMFLCYKDDLLEQLTKCYAGFKLLGMNVCCPTVADDMVILALTVCCLALLLCICYAYSCKWRYEYSTPKCSVIVYNETKRQFLNSNRVWYMGNDTIMENENYKHLGVNTNKYLSHTINIKDATDRLKGTFLSLVHSGVLHQDNLHPLTCIKIYNSVVLPKALYGCENWFDLTESEILSLERAHRFCVKHMQSLSKRTRTDAALSLLGVYPIELEIDSRKLTLFGQMCRLNSNSWVKNVFLNRLTSFTTHSNGRQTGFIADIFRLLGKYQLRHVLEAYLESSIFPSKFAWKRILKSTLHESAISSWHNRIHTQDFSRFTALHYDYSPHWIWYFLKEHRKLLPHCTSVIQMISSLAEVNSGNKLCIFCEVFYENIVDHCLHDCSYLDNERSEMWQGILSLSLPAYGYLFKQNISFVSNVLLGMKDRDLEQILGESQEAFKICCIRNIHNMWRKYKML